MHNSYKMCPYYIPDWESFEALVGLYDGLKGNVKPSTAAAKSCRFIVKILADELNVRKSRDVLRGHDSRSQGVQIQIVDTAWSAHGAVVSLNRARAGSACLINM